MYDRVVAILYPTFSRFAILVTHIVSYPVPYVYLVLHGQGCKFAGGKLGDSTNKERKSVSWKKIFILTWPFIFLCLVWEYDRSYTFKIFWLLQFFLPSNFHEILLVLLLVVLAIWYSNEMANLSDKFSLVNL